MNKSKDNTENGSNESDSPEGVSGKNKADEESPISKTGLSRRKLLQAALAAPAIAALSSAIPGNTIDQAEARNDRAMLHPEERTKGPEKVTFKRNQNALKPAEYELLGEEIVQGVRNLSF